MSDIVVYFLFYFACVCNLHPTSVAALLLPLLTTPVRACVPYAGDIHQAQVRSDEESLRAVGAVRLRDRFDHLQQLQQAVPVRLHRHGQSAAQIHRI